MKPVDEVNEKFAALVGEEIPGGCDSCDAYQMVVPMQLPHMWTIQVYHDDWCPVLKRMQAAKPDAPGG